MAFKNYREQSRIGWGKEGPENEGLTNEQISLGCLLRIADASEAMAKNHVALIRERDQLAAHAKWQAEEIARLERQRAALRGAITRLKKSALNPPRGGGEKG